MKTEVMDYQAPGWLPGGQLQTLWPALCARRVQGARVAYRRERWDTPDGDFVDVDWLDAPQRSVGAPLLVLFHGLEGSSRSHYAEAFAAWARTQGLGFAVPHFRGCSGELNRAPRSYHSGDYEEIDWMLARLQAAQQARGGGPLLAVGISLGGNALLRWAAEAGSAAAARVRAVAAVCSPLDLTAADRLRAARDLYQFDDVFTAPLHGFVGVEDYWRRASAKPQLARIRVPALALNARNDPFVPDQSLPRMDQVDGHVTLWQPPQGGHVGFTQGAPRGELSWLPQAVGGWLLARAA